MIILYSFTFCLTTWPTYAQAFTCPGIFGYKKLTELRFFEPASYGSAADWLRLPEGKSEALKRDLIALNNLREQYVGARKSKRSVVAREFKELLNELSLYFRLSLRELADHKNDMNREIRYLDPNYSTAVRLFNEILLDAALNAHFTHTILAKTLKGAEKELLSVDELKEFVIIETEVFSVKELSEPFHIALKELYIGLKPSDYTPKSIGQTNIYSLLRASARNEKMDLFLKGESISLSPQSITFMSVLLSRHPKMATPEIVSRGLMLKSKDTLYKALAAIQLNKIDLLYLVLKQEK